MSIEALSLTLNYMMSGSQCNVDEYFSQAQSRQLILALLMIAGIEPNPGPPITALQHLDSADDYLAAAGPPDESRALDYMQVGRNYLASDLAAPVRTEELPAGMTRWFTPLDPRGIHATPVRLPVEMSPYHVLAVSSLGGPHGAETADGAAHLPTISIEEAPELPGEIRFKKTEAATLEGALTTDKCSLRVLPGNITREGMRYEDVIPLYDNSIDSTSCDAPGIRAAQFLLARNGFHTGSNAENFIVQSQPDLIVNVAATAALGGNAYQIKPVNPPAGSQRLGTIPAPAPGPAMRNLAMEGWLHCLQQTVFGRNGGMPMPNLRFVTHMQLIPPSQRNACIIISNAAARDASDRLSAYIALLLALLAPGCMEFPVRSVVCDQLQTGPDGYPVVPNVVTQQVIVELGTNMNLISTPGYIYYNVLMPMLDLSIVRQTPVQLAATPAVIAASFPQVLAPGFGAAAAAPVAVSAAPAGGGTHWMQYVSRHVAALDLSELALGLKWCEKFYLPGLFNAVHRAFAIMCKVTSVPYVQLGPTLGRPLARPPQFVGGPANVVANPVVSGQAIACGARLPSVMTAGNVPLVQERTATWHIIRPTDPRVITFLACGVIEAESIDTVLNHRWWYDAYLMYGVMQVGYTIAVSFQRSYMFCGLPAALILTRRAGQWAGIAHSQAIADALVDYEQESRTTTALVRWSGNLAVKILGGTTGGVKESFLIEGHLLASREGVPLLWQVFDEQPGANVFVFQYIPVAFASWAIAAFARVQDFEFPGSMRPIPENGPTNRLTCPNRTVHSDIVTVGGGAAVRWVIDTEGAATLGNSYSDGANLPDFDTLSSMRRMARLIRGYNGSDPVYTFIVSDRAGAIIETASDVIFYQSRSPLAGTSHPAVVAVNPAPKYLLECTDPISGLRPNREILRLHVPDFPDVDQINMALDGLTPLGIPTLLINSRSSTNNRYVMPGQGSAPRRRPAGRETVQPTPSSAGE